MEKMKNIIGLAEVNGEPDQGYGDISEGRNVIKTLLEEKKYNI